MCGVIGFKGKYNSNIVTSLIKESSIRGIHSFGFSYIDKEIVTKKFHKIEDAINSINDIKPSEFIFHNRYSTSGDFKDHNNNQPIAMNNSSLVFNGVISQKSKQEMELEYNVKMNTENDGEIFLKKNFSEEFIKSIRGSFAGIWIQDGIKYFRNSRRPLYRVDLSDFSVIASTEDIMKRSGLYGYSIEPNKVFSL